MRNAEKRFISLWTRLYQTPSSTTPTPKQRSRTSKKEASSRPSRWTQTGRKRGTPPNRSCDQARKTPRRPACLPTPNHLPALPLSAQPSSDTHHRIYIKQPNTPRQSIQTKLKLCRGVLYACNAFSGEPTKLLLQSRCASCPSIKVARLHYDKYISNYCLNKFYRAIIRKICDIFPFLAAG